MSIYFNENDPQMAAWLRQLMRDGLLPEGDVDERSITEVESRDVRGYTRCHFFAGIGGWELALSIAGWPTDVPLPVWTGSCPCQPFSTAGRRQGRRDARHLWPAWFRLIQECRPALAFGEQVETAVQHGWLDTVCSDLEGEGYACGSVVLGAHSVGAPHRRQRVWWVAERDREAVCRMAIANSRRRQKPRLHIHQGQSFPAVLHTARAGEVNPWGFIEWLPCQDGKYRPAEPGIQPLAHGVPDRMGLLRGAGNAIVPEVAAAFIDAYREVVYERMV